MPLAARGVGRGTGDSRASGSYSLWALPRIYDLGGSRSVADCRLLLVPQTILTMRPTSRLLYAVTHANDATRARTTGFIGLGRMGYEMAYNLFSQTLVESGGSARFVVCDAREESSVMFVKNFNGHFPGAKIEVMTSPAE